MPPRGIEALAVAATGPIDKGPAVRPPEPDPNRYGPSADPPAARDEKPGQPRSLRRMPPIAEMASNAPVGPQPVRSEPAPAIARSEPKPMQPSLTWPGSENPPASSAPNHTTIVNPHAAQAAPAAPALEAAAPVPPRRDLLPAPLAPQEVAAMRTVDLQAQQKLVRAQEMAARGAAWSARGELLEVLQMVAESCDSLRQSDEFRRCLHNGLEALREVEDFTPKSGSVGREISVAAMVSTHRTPALKGAPLDHITPLAAQQEYLSYAQRQLGAAAAGTVSGSAALYGLGRLQDTLAAAPGTTGRSPAALPRAMALYQAALIADRTNHLAANELGVLLAKYGENAAARQLLIMSLQTQQQAITWNNLAVIHERLGELDLARQARASAQQMASRSGGSAAMSDRVRWVDASTFAATSEEGGWPEAPAAPSAAPAKKPAAPVAKAPETKSTDSKTASSSNDTGWSFPFWTARGGTTATK